MRKKNAFSEFDGHRRRVLTEAFAKALATDSERELKKIFKQVSESPAPRFWVSEQRASAVLGQVRKNPALLSSMYPAKRAMYTELQSRYERLSRKSPQSTEMELLTEIINSPAPCHYMSPDRVRTLIYEEKRLRRLRRELGLARKILEEGGLI